MKQSQILVPRVPGRGRQEIEAVAHKFLRDFAPACLKTPTRAPAEQFFDLVLPKHYKFQPGVEDLAPGLLGFTDCGARTCTLAAHVYDALSRNDGPARFTACHEIGHVALHSKVLSRTKVRFLDHAESAPVLARRGDLPAFEDPEWQANTFAAALLMPSAMVIAVLSKVGRPQLVREMMRVFAVSREAAERRLATIGRTAIRTGSKRLVNTR